MAAEWNRRNFFFWVQSFRSRNDQRQLRPLNSESPEGERWSIEKSRYLSVRLVGAEHINSLGPVLQKSFFPDKILSLGVRQEIRQRNR